MAKAIHSVTRMFLAMSVGITLTDHVVTLTSVHGDSMQPTLNPIPMNKGDFVLLNKWCKTKGKSAYKRGDIVVLTSPTDPNEHLIKRIVGLEGDIVRRNSYSRSKDKDRCVYIPRGHCWIEGDNINRSIDSNRFGPVSLSLIQGRVETIVWPPSRFGTIEKKEPSARRFKQKNPLCQ